MTRKINNRFKEYLNSLGFSNDKINEAWIRTNQTIYEDNLTLEVMTRDLLQKPEEAEKQIKEYLRNEFK